MKQITVKSCGECPYYGRYYYDHAEYQTCLKTGRQEKISARELYKDCPLSDVPTMPTREKALRLIKRVSFEGYDCNIEETLNELGFKKEGK